MPDIIRLLPDSIANQIAAGEVVQRPASAVKELLENAIDSGTSSVLLLVKDSGKTLIQVIDQGTGMSDTDARMSFERHATSKIRNADDLFSIQTKGFRGEALASIAAIAQVELKTRKADQELGTCIHIEGSEVKSQETCACASGTSIAVRNLFYNVPARRNFLKSDAVEFRHIVDEFERVAIAHPEVSFTLNHNNTEVFNLQASNLRQRLVALFGNPYNARLVPLAEHTDILGMNGFIGKPEFAKRTRGEQFFFVNHRFIRNAYLHHAVQSAYSELLPKDTFPSYFIFLEVDPRTIDINIHPTKTEIKFEDERTIYALLRSTVKKSLGQYNIAPSLDFEQEMGIELPLNPENRQVTAPEIKVDKSFNPFRTDKMEQDTPAPDYFKNISWDKQYSRHAYNQLDLVNKQDAEHRDPEQEETQQTMHGAWDTESDKDHAHKTFQLHNRYILAHIKSGFLLIDQQRAHERILFERILETMRDQKAFSQKNLFPDSIQFSSGDMICIQALMPDLHAMGYEISEFGANTVVVNGVPSTLTETNTKGILEELIDDYKHHQSEFRNNQQECIAKLMARKGAIQGGKKLSGEEMNRIVDELFACSMPYSTPDGKPTVLTFGLDELERRFKK
ncbi:MAG: DNA mismatch repair endonuclease MutL [Bacteroidia bacterium]